MRLIYLAIAYLALGVAFLGILLPGLPTTEFLLIAAWAAAKSSPRLHRWMLNHRLFGPPLHDWNNGRIVRLRTKLIASSMMMVAAVVLIVKISHLPSLAFCLVGMSLGAIWIWSRPSQRKVAD